VTGFNTVDDLCWLVSHENRGVVVHCGACDSGGQPIAWYGGYGVPNPYHDIVPTAHTITALAALAARHVSDVHGNDPVTCALCGRGWPPRVAGAYLMTASLFIKYERVDPKRRALYEALPAGAVACMNWATCERVRTEGMKP
jgi:hypothetical protein